MHLPNDVVPGIPVEAEHDKVQRHGLQVGEGEPVEGKVLVVGGIPRVAYDPEWRLGGNGGKLERRRCYYIFYS